MSSCLRPFSHSIFFILRKTCWWRTQRRPQLVLEHNITIAEVNMIFILNIWIITENHARDLPAPPSRCSCHVGNCEGPDSTDSTVSTVSTVNSESSTCSALIRLSVSSTAADMQIFSNKCLDNNWLTENNLTTSYTVHCTIHDVLFFISYYTFSIVDDIQCWMMVRNILQDCIETSQNPFCKLL